jgi:hypothetical protein
VDIWFEGSALWVKEKTGRHFANKISNKVQVLMGGVLSMSLLCLDKITFLITITPIFPVRNPLLLTEGKYTRVPFHYSMHYKT